MGELHKAQELPTFAILYIWFCVLQQNNDSQAGSVEIAQLCYQASQDILSQSRQCGKQVGLVLALLFPRTLHFYFSFYWTIIIKLKRMLIRDQILHLIKVFLFKWELALQKSKTSENLFLPLFSAPIFTSDLLPKKVDWGQGLKCKWCSYCVSS